MSQTRLFHRRLQKSSLKEMRWTSEPDSTFPKAFTKVESEKRRKSEPDSTFPQAFTKAESERNEAEK